MNHRRFERNDTLLSLCGLNCSLCPMFVRGDCKGCRAGSWCARFCKIAPCSVRHGGISYCFECPEYPCPRYDGIDKRDSLISHRNQLKDMDKAKRMGIEAYRDEQRAKAALLHRLLDEYDDSTRDVFFCLAANMLEVDDLQTAVDAISASAEGLSTRSKAELAERELRRIATVKDVPLELRTWNGPW